MKKEGPSGIAPTPANINTNPAPAVDLDEMFRKRMKTTRAFPTKGDMWRMPPQSVNPDGDITLGVALALQRENFSKMRDMLPPDSRSKLTAPTDMQAPPLHQ